MGCMAYVRVDTNDMVHSCSITEKCPTIGDHLSIDGIDYVVDDVVKEITKCEYSVRIMLKAKPL